MMSTFLSARSTSRLAIGHRPGASPVDHALTLLLADETEAALRWGAAALERDPLSPTALILTSRLLDQMGRTRAATDGLRLASQRAIEMGDLPMAVAAIDDLRILGADAGDQLDQAANAFCRGSPRLRQGQQPLPPPRFGDFLEPLSPFLGGPPLASRATQILLAAKQAHDEAIGAELPPLGAWPMFSALSWESLRDVLSTFQLMTVPAGQQIIREGEEGTAAYIVAQGEVELARRAAFGDNKPRLTLGRLGNGAFFGEMALLTRLPSAMSVTTTRPSMLLVGRRDALVALASRRPEVAVQLAAHCRRTSLTNLGWTSPVIASIRAEDCESLVERLEMRVFERGEKLVRDREEARGLHLIVSGEVAVVAREWSERVLLATLGAGETVGEVELVLCRQAYADAVAVRPTAALFLSRDEYSALVQDRPAILHGLYATAVRRHAETRLALESGSSTVDDSALVEDDSTVTRVIADREATAPAPRILSAQSQSYYAPSRPPPIPSVQPPPPMQPPPVYAANDAPSDMPPPVSEKAGSSVAPTSASVAPKRVSIARLSIARLQQVNLTAVSAAAFFASAAGVLLVLVLHSAHSPSSQAMGAAASAPPAPIPTLTTAVESPPPATADSAWAPAVPRPLAKNKALAHTAVPKPRIVLGPAPAIEAGVSSQMPAASASAAASASTVAEAAPAATSLRVSTRAAQASDEFGGRE